jgi:hypothetical protein
MKKEVKARLPASKPWLVKVDIKIASLRRSNRKQFFLETSSNSKEKGEEKCRKLDLITSKQCHSTHSGRIPLLGQRIVSCMNLIDA